MENYDNALITSNIMTQVSVTSESKLCTSIEIPEHGALGFMWGTFDLDDIRNIDEVTSSVDRSDSEVKSKIDAAEAEYDRHKDKAGVAYLMAPDGVSDFVSKVVSNSMKLNHVRTSPTCVIKAIVSRGGVDLGDDVQGDAYKLRHGNKIIRGLDHASRNDDSLYERSVVDYAEFLKGTLGVVASEIFGYLEEQVDKPNRGLVLGAYSSADPLTLWRSPEIHSWFTNNKLIVE